ncbi:MAG: ribosome biogenesis GTPase YlqF [Clostridiaceae bacterium]|jgi:ribosome biogenesis GTPase A|nr:ribosome biogenesis GTPase YlqF [Clostridiaceae bacterium]
MATNWFPGHMAKALREMKEMLKQVDLVIETCDARIPAASRNPELVRLIQNKPSLLVLNKEDLADPAVTRLWLEQFASQGLEALPCSSIRRLGCKQIVLAAKRLTQDKTDRALAKGRIFRPVRILVAGIPNTGKSTLINALSSRKAAQTADKPGVTRQLSWIKAGPLELLDSPGVLWPRIDSQLQQRHLAATGAIKDNLLSGEDIARQTLEELCRLYPDLIRQRFRIDPLAADLDRLEQAAVSRGCLMSGGRADIERFAALFLDELRGGRIGRISLEKPGAAG